MAKVEVVKSEKADKPNYIWIGGVIVALLLYGFVYIWANSDSLNSNKTVDQFLNAPLVGCPNKTLKESIDAFNNYENLSVKYSVENGNDQDFFLLTIYSPNDNIYSVLALDDDNNVFVAKATSDSIENYGDNDELSLNAALTLTKMLCE